MQLRPKSTLAHSAAFEADSEQCAYIIQYQNHIRYDSTPPVRKMKVLHRSGTVGPWADGQILSPIPNFCFHGVAKISSTEPRRAELDGDNQVFEWLWFYELTTSFKQSRMSSKDLWHTGAKNQGRVPGPKLSKTFE